MTASGVLSGVRKDYLSLFLERTDSGVARFTPVGKKGTTWKPDILNVNNDPMSGDSRRDCCCSQLDTCKIKIDQELETGVYASIRIMCSRPDVREVRRRPIREYVYEDVSHRASDTSFSSRFLQSSTL